jgi:hypothetical protein
VNFVVMLLYVMEKLAGINNRSWAMKVLTL